MTRNTNQWQRHTDGLRSHAQRKAAATQQRAEAAIALLIRQQRHTNFHTVAQTAGSVLKLKLEALRVEVHAAESSNTDYFGKPLAAISRDDLLAVDVFW